MFMPVVRARRHATTRFGAAVLLAVLTSCGSEGPHNAPTSVVVADFNGDGTPDVAFSAALVSGKGNAASYPGLVSILMNSHSSPGTFAAGVHYTTGNNPTALKAADLTGSGKLDLVVADYTAGTLSILMHSTTTPGAFEPAQTITVGGLPHDVAIGDLNGDGKLDIAVADRTIGAGRVVILFQDPNNPGHFLAPQVLSLVNAVSSLAIADLTANGKQDIIAANSDAGGNNGQVSIYYQNVSPGKEGTFLAPVTFPAGSQPTSVQVADMNGDGLPDIVVGDLGPGTDGAGFPGLSVLIQDSTNPGSFLPLAPYETISGVIAIAIGDVNNDGIPDVVSVNLGTPTGSVSIFTGDTTTRGVLDTGNTYGGLSQPSGAWIQDVNGDGLPDIVLADGLGASVLYQASPIQLPDVFNPAVQICTVC
jgi:hypothetical protein